MQALENNVELKHRPDRQNDRAIMNRVVIILFAMVTNDVISKNVYTAYTRWSDDVQAMITQW